MKSVVKHNETLLLGIVGMVMVCGVLCGLYLVWARPKFLYMPLYDSGGCMDDDSKTEMKEGQGQDLELV